MVKQKKSKNAEFNLPIYGKPIRLNQTSKPGYINLFKFFQITDLVIVIPALFVTIASALTTPALTVLLGLIFNSLSLYSSGSISKSGFMSQVISCIAGILSLGLAMVILTWAMITLWSVFGDRQVYRARKLLFSSIIYHDLEWFDKSAQIMGELASSHRNIEEFRIAVSVALSFVILGLTTTISSLALSFYHSWSLTLVSLAGFPVIVLVGIGTSIPVRKNLLTSKKAITSASDSMHWAVTSISTVKIFQKEGLETKQFNFYLDLAYKASIKMYNFLNIQEGLIKTIVLVMFAQSFYYGNKLIKTGKIDSGAVVIVFWCCLSVAQSLRGLTSQFMFLQKGNVAAARILESIDPGVDAIHKFKSKIGLYPAPCSGDIIFKNVSRVIKV